MIAAAYYTLFAGAAAWACTVIGATLIAYGPRIREALAFNPDRLP